eukprot:CAMPEP_0197725606 /NCGR_PEP_ID=MMETSP1434-20131217/7852_1 /TAXON_ID=265543 /ORGANISM="Minutocellus polymorphus, Strain CCMP3303" /LENGTH=99 /DNA_ID=CAMNT_0043311141 /DNA_START=40 /DNA_END=340 /DNA_ORIENTATION=+
MTEKDEKNEPQIAVTAEPVASAGGPQQAGPPIPPVTPDTTAASVMLHMICPIMRQAGDAPTARLSTRSLPENASGARYCRARGAWMAGAVILPGLLWIG